MNGVLSDYMVSSYTPSISVLLGPRHVAPPRSIRFLAVSQPNAPGAAAVPNTSFEVQAIKDILPTLKQTHQLACREDSTTTRVLDDLQNCTHAHFASHGVQDKKDPATSGFLLQDGLLRLDKLMKESFPEAEFAFLSACESAAGDTTLPEESIHMAAGMQLAGFTSIVATMWPIRDDDGLSVSREFYAKFLADGEARGDQAARALHAATEKMRKEGFGYTSWVPFIHIGV